MTDTSSQGRRTYEVIRSTWLSRRPHFASAFVAALSTFLLVVGSLAYWSDIGGSGSWMAASYESVYQTKEIWRLWTTVFAHADLGHLLSNCFLFFVLGYFLYGYFGGLFFPVAALICGGLTNAIVLTTYDARVQLIGASGVVYWMGGAWLILYFFLSRQKNAWHRWLRTLGVGILLFMPTSEVVVPNVSHRTHFIGFVLGVVSGTVYYLLRRQTFLAAETRETLVDDSDPGDDLPGPEGFPIGRATVRTALEFRGSRLAHSGFSGERVILQLDGVVHMSEGQPGRDAGHLLSQPIQLHFFEVSHPERLSIKEGTLEDGELQIETTTFHEAIPLPFSYQGVVRLTLRLEGESEPLEIEARGFEASALGPGRFVGPFLPGHA